VSNLVQRVDTSIRERRLLRAGQSVLVAVSGGVDSMALLEVLVRLVPKLRCRLHVAHFNHQLRGRASDADERLVRATVKRLRLPFASGRGDVRRLAREQKVSIEMAARHARHEFLARVARERGIRAVALAHHADDQVELFFLRLLRGAGARGLAGMKWSNASPADKRLTLVRPLLDCSKADLKAFAREAKVPFREDASNASPDFLRNRIRQELLPLLESRYQPALARVVLRQMAILGDETELLEKLARDWRRKRSPGFATLATALQRRVLQAELMDLGLGAEFELVEKIRTSPGRDVMFERSLVLCHDGYGRVRRATVQRVVFDAEQSVLNFKGRGGQGAFGGLAWKWQASNGASSQRPKFADGHEWFDADKIGGKGVLRHWQPGDRFQPAGLGKPAKLQDLFTNQKIPRERRHQLVVAATASGEIWWVEGLRISERFKLTAETRRRLKWVWRRDDLMQPTQDTSPETPAARR
jgi:tRNA(Ile)-lysidine synthase